MPWRKGRRRPAISPFRFFRTVRSSLSYTSQSATTRRSLIRETRFTSLPEEKGCSLMVSSATPSRLVRFSSFPPATRIALRTFHLTSLFGSRSTDRREANRVLSTPFHKYDHVCGEGFSAQTRRERRAYPSGVCKARATTSGPKRTAARRAASLFGSGVVAPRSSRQVGTGDAPSSRLASTAKRRSQRRRIYELEY